MQREIVDCGGGRSDGTLSTYDKNSLTRPLHRASTPVGRLQSITSIP